MGGPDTAGGGGGNPGPEPLPDASATEPTGPDASGLIPRPGDPNGGGIGGGGEGPGKGSLFGKFSVPGAVTTTDYDWHINDLERLLGAISARTNVDVKVSESYVDPATHPLEDTPILIFTGHHSFKLPPAEQEAIRKYVEGGGMIWGDDSQTEFDSSFRLEMEKVFQVKAEALPKNHPIYLGDDNVLYNISNIPPGDLGDTRPFACIRAPGHKDRLAVVITHNRYFGSLDGPPHVTAERYEQALQVGTNITLFAIEQYVKVHGR